MVQTDQFLFKFILLVMMAAGLGLFFVVSVYGNTDTIKPFCDKMNYDDETCQTFRDAIEGPLHRQANFTFFWTNMVVFILASNIFYNRTALVDPLDEGTPRHDRPRCVA